MENLQGHRGCKQLGIRCAFALGAFLLALNAQAQPDTISGLQLYLKASSLTLGDGDPITNWADETANGYDFENSSGVNEPEYNTAFTDASALWSPDSTEILDIQAEHNNNLNFLHDGSSWSFVVFAQFNNDDDGSIYESKGEPTTHIGTALRHIGGVSHTHKLEIDIGNGTGTAHLFLRTADNAVTEGDCQVIIFTFDGSSGEIFVDNASKGTASVSGSASGSNPTVAPNLGSTSESPSMDVFEIAIYEDKVLNASERSSLQTYYEQAVCAGGSGLPTDDDTVRRRGHHRTKVY